MQRPTRSPSPHGMTLRAAASTVQRIWRGRKQRGVIDKWMEAVRQLRASYIDARAAAAGAKESPLYTDTALAAREALRGTLEVQAALEMGVRWLSSDASELRYSTQIKIESVQ